jgi:hypothetical protein
MKGFAWVLPIVALASVTGRAAVFVYPRADCIVMDRNWGGPNALYQYRFTGNDYDPNGYVQFGYTSFQATDTTISQGNNNILVQDPQFRNQPTLYHPGTHLDSWGTTWDPSIGLSWFLNGAFATADTSLPACPGMSAAGGPLPPQIAPLGVASGQTVRLTVFPSMGSGGCSGTLSFADGSGTLIRPTAGPGVLAPLITQVNLSAKQVFYIELVGSAVTTAGHRMLIQPRFVTNSYDSCQTSVEVYATSTGVTAAMSRPMQPVYQYGFDPQSLSAGQTLRVNVAAAQGQSCGAAVSFADASGAVLGSSLNTTLAAGTAASIDLPSTSVPGLTGWAGGHVPVVPQVYTVATGAGTGYPGPLLPKGILANGVLVSETCFASVEIFDTLTGYTRSVQNPQPIH